MHCKTLGVFLLLIAPMKSFAQPQENASTLAASPGATSQHGPSGTGEVLGVLISTFNVYIGIEGHKLAIPAYKVLIEDSTIICYAPPYAVDVKDALIGFYEDGRWTEMTLPDANSELAAGSLSPNTPVLLTLPVTLADSTIFRRSVLQDCVRQGKIKLAAKGEEVEIEFDDQLVNAKCVPLQVRSFILALHSGEETFAVMESDPNLAVGTTMELQCNTSAGVVARILSKAGVSISMRFQPLLQKSNGPEGGGTS